MKPSLCSADFDTGSDAAFRSDLRALINQARADGLGLDMITRLAWGNFS